MANELETMLRGGHYARKQLLCRDRIVAWSHRGRFVQGRALIEPFAGKGLLDYGCGDGTFLALVHDLFPRAVGADLDVHQIHECRDRFAEVFDLQFFATPELEQAVHQHAHDVVVCMEVLEHCLDEPRRRVLQDLHGLVKPEGHVIISVPVEIGPSLLIKQMVRTVAGWRGLGDYQYRERYGWGELWQMMFARARTAIRRPEYPGKPHSYHGHKGFNWRTLRCELEERFHVERILFSPLGWLGGWLSSQAWFVCRPR